MLLQKLDLTTRSQIYFYYSEFYDFTLIYSDKFGKHCLKLCDISQNLLLNQIIMHHKWNLSKVQKLESGGMKGLTNFFHLITSNFSTFYKVHSIKTEGAAWLSGLTHLLDCLRCQGSRVQFSAIPSFFVIVIALMQLVGDQKAIG